VKKSGIAVSVIAAALAAVLLTACGKSEFAVTENSEKLMLITAKNADKDDFFAAGTLEVEEGEQVRITSDLKKGSIRVEVYGPDERTIEESPDLDGEVALTADLASKDGGKEASSTMPAGSYMMRATCLEKATGTIKVIVEPETAEPET